MLKSGEHIVPEAALEALADQNIVFSVKGKAMYPGIDMAAIKALPADDRVLLAHAILDTVTEEAEAHELTDEQKAELERRVERYRNNPDDVIAWEEVKARVRAKRES